jgi:hypothetical protein
MMPLPVGDTGRGGRAMALRIRNEVVVTVAAGLCWALLVLLLAG